MGWVCLHRDRGQSNLDWIRENLVSSEPERLIDCATKGGVIYAAYRSDDRVVALVILTKWVPNDHFNFCYKDLDEDMGPYEDDCPKRIFELLDPLPPDRADPNVDGNWAAQWRRRVQAKLDRPEVKPGTKVRFPGYRWSGGDYGICTYIGGRRQTNLFRSQDGALVRFRGWRNGPYEVVT